VSAQRLQAVGNLRGTRVSLAVLVAGFGTVLVSLCVDRAAGFAPGWWEWAVGAAAATAGSGVLAWSLGRQPGPARMQLRLADADGIPLRLADVTVADLGVHPSPLARTGEEATPYLPRDVDAAVAAAVTGDAPLVVVSGPRLAGCTRTLAEAAVRLLPAATVVVPVEDPAIGVSQLIREARSWAGPGEQVVLWLDRLSADRLRQFQPDVMAGTGPGVRVFATVDAELLRGRPPLPPDAACVPFDVLSEAEVRRLARHRRYRHLAPHALRRPLGQLLVTTTELERGARLTDEASVGTVAVLRAATDWYRVGAYGRLGERTLRLLYRAYRDELGGGYGSSAAGWRAALASASAFVTVHEQDSERWYAPHPLLSLVVAQDPGWPIGEPLWAHLAATLDGERRLDLGARCLAARDHRHAAALLDPRGVDGVDPGDLLFLAYGLHRDGRLLDARRWYRRVITSGHPEHAPTAMLDLGVLEREDGQPDEARRWFGEAIATRHRSEAPRGMVNLGVLDRELGRVDEARRWYEEAIRSRDPDQAPRAMVNLGILERKEGHVAAARRQFRDAVASGHPDQAPAAMVNLGLLEGREGRLAEARRWYIEAIGTRHPVWAGRATRAIAVLVDADHGSARPRSEPRWS
jgi:tetratricopeptide (TPR) repeat protein